MGVNDLSVGMEVVCKQWSRGRERPRGNESLEGPDWTQEVILD